MGNIDYYYAFRDTAITLKEIELMYHAIGLDRDRPKRGVYRMYRNYFSCHEPDEVWEGLCQKGLAGAFYLDEDGSVTYKVSGMGLALLERFAFCKMKK
jgi:hypothetical protein